MAGVYNRFEIKLDNKILVEKVKETAEKLFQETNYKMEGEYLVWDNIDISGGVLSAEIYCGADENDLKQSRELFEDLCKKITAEYIMLNFMGMHSFDYSSTNTIDYLLCFRKSSNLQFYQAEVVGDVGCMSAKRYNINYSLLKFEYKDEHNYEDLFFDNDEEVDNDFMKVLDGYESFKYPKVSKKKSDKDKRTAKKAVEKYILEKGKFYRVKCHYYGKQKEFIGIFDKHYLKTYDFITFGESFDTVEEPDIISINEVFETEETKQITAEYDNTGKIIETSEGELAKLRDEFYTLYTLEGEHWHRSPLERIDIGQSYPALTGIECGKTYTVKVKKDFSEIGTDVVLVVNRYEDVIGDGFRVMGCVPGVFKSGIVKMRPVVVWNLDEFIDEVLPSEAGLEIQKKRMELYNCINELHGKCNQLKKDYMDSFKE